MKNYLIQIKILSGMLLLTMAIVIGFAFKAFAEEPEKFYKGKTIDWIVSSSPGSATDLLTRIAAVHFGKEIGAKVRIENMDQNKGVNHVFTRAKPDGLTFVSKATSAVLFNELAKAPGIQYKSNDFIYLTDLMVDTGALFVKPGSPFTTLYALRNKQGLKAGATSAKGFLSASAAVLFEVVGLNGKVIPGYKGPPQVILALAQNEVDFMVFQMASGLRQIKEGSLQPVFVTGKERFAAAPNIPTLEQLGVKISSQWAGAFALINESGQAVMAPPGVPTDRIQFIRETFKRLSQKAEVRKEIENLTGYWAPFEPGENMQTRIEEIMADKELGDRLTAVVNKYSAAAK
ncbi:MAG: hypothetical protein A2169_14365 [Deltaproteobacteria bacterium RBG_13_47_9]|nr:MAG: hypothetical protein A2169_14365 [Deltaproteobacteria bacterium RBG_13_47_9]